MVDPFECSRELCHPLRPPLLPLQVPQFILDDAIQRGEGGRVSIICTQPRRISATSVAQRVAAERGEQIGGTVGYQVRHPEPPQRIMSAGDIVSTPTECCRHHRSTSACRLRYDRSRLVSNWPARLCLLIVQSVEEALADHGSKCSPPTCPNPLSFSDASPPSLTDDQGSPSAFPPAILLDRCVAKFCVEKRQNIL